MTSRGLCAVSQPVWGKWDRRFLELADLIATWSKDPSTKVGAVIVDPSRRIVSTGYNGFAQGVKDHDERYQDRDKKLQMVVHAERNALLFARRDLSGCTLYSTFPPCSACSAMVIQSGIVRVVSRREGLDNPRWRGDFEVARQMYEESGVIVSYVDLGGRA